MYTPLRQRPVAEAWVNFGGVEEHLLAKVRSCDIILSDLDGTDTPSTGAREVLRYAASHLFGRDFLRWSWRAARAYLADENISGAHVWHGFAARFLAAPSEKKPLRRTYTPKHAASLLYPGVPEFYGRFRAAEKIYITKTVYEIAVGFALASNFDHVLADVWDKAHVAQRIVERLPHRRRYLVKGDTHHDEAVLDVLCWYKGNGTIDDVVGINVCKSDDHINPRFDINIGRDYRALVARL